MLVVVCHGGIAGSGRANACASAARTQSTNNLKQIALSFASFHDVNNRLPYNGTIPAAPGDEKSGSWAFQILPYIDQAPYVQRPESGHRRPGVHVPRPWPKSYLHHRPWTDYAINPWLNDP